MKPSPGRILHFYVPNTGWRPMLVTKVGETNDDLPVVSGWVKLSPEDCDDTTKERLQNYGHKPILVRNELPVVEAFEGVGSNNWRWPPRV